MSNPIGWCDETINPIVGCSKCSPGCDNCYAERFAARLARNPQTAAKYRGVVDERGRWTGQVTTSVHSKDMPHRVPGKCKRVFVGSMTDLFHPNVSDATRDAIFASMLCDHVRANSNDHTYMILSKRPHGMHKYFSEAKKRLLRWGRAGDAFLDDAFSEYVEEYALHNEIWPLPNVWVGVTVCNQAEADAKIPVLLQIPASKRFVSVEPMLGPVDLRRIVSPDMADGNFLDSLQGTVSVACFGGIRPKCAPALNWIICGGETGPGARPMHPEWARSLRDQCQSAGVPFYFKGWGEWRPGGMSLHRFDLSVRRAILKSGLPGIPSADMYRIGKKRAGCFIDGQEWRQFPAQEAADVS